MSDQLPMFEPMTSLDILNATSSPESESGPTPLGLRDGLTTAKSGLAPAPANPSARPAKAKRSTTKGIFGQSGFHSSKHENLSYALGSKLRQSTDSLGSTLFSLTWMTRATPAGRSISALRASEPLTEGSVFIGWPTPKSSDMTGGQAKRSVGRANLSDFAMLAGWKTPCVPNGGRISGNTEDIGKHRDGTKAQIGLENEAKLSGWTTPQAHDETGLSKGQKEIHGTMRSRTCLAREARLTAFGETPIGYLLGPDGWEIVPASGQLNAAHSRWLMGLPPVWDACGVTAMELSRKRRKPSLKRT